MTPGRPTLSLAPEECDACGRCLRRCHAGALKIGPGYIYVDWDACDGCMACAEVCDREAIEPRVVQGSPPARPAAANPPRAAEAAGKPGGGKGTAPRRRPGRAAWGTPEALAVLSLTLVLFFVNSAVFASPLVKSLPVRQLVVVRAAVLGGYYASQLLLLGYLARRARVPFASAFRLDLGGARWREAASAAGLVVALFLATRLVATGYGALTDALGWHPPGRWNSLLTDVFGPDGLGFALSLVTVVGIGPFVEEIVFRGVLFDALAVRGPAVAMAGSAAVFAVAHFEAWAFVPSLVLGLGLAWLADTRRTLWPAVALHALYNAAAVAAAFYLASRGA